MTDMMVRPTSFEFPAPTKPLGGLLDIVTVQDGIGFLDPKGLVESYNCLRLDSVASWPCPLPGAPAATPAKSFFGPGWQDGIRFAVYGGVVCKGPGFNMDDGRTKTQAAFEAMESVGVERGLLSTRFRASQSSAGLWDPPRDLTPAGGAVAPAAGLGILEGDAACHYAGQPIIHAPRQVASLLTGVQGSVVREGNTLTTKLGTRVAAGGGYGCPNTGPDGADAPAGELWMYVSGDVVVARSDLIVASDINRSTNEVFVLVERAYVAAVDCYVAAVRVKVT